MTKNIQAYFPSENEAESVKSLLQAYDTQHLEIGEISEGDRGSGVAFVAPAFNGNIGTGGTGGTLGGTGAFGTGGVVPFISAGDDDDLEGMHYVLSAEVNDRDYTKIIEVIHDNKGKIVE